MTYSVVLHSFSTQSEDSMTDRLRKAAQVLRERAEKATPGPWTEGKIIYGQVIAPDPDDDRGLLVSDSPESRDAQWIATIHPGVGLALADWLHAVADRGNVPDPHEADEPC